MDNPGDWIPVLRAHQEALKAVCAALWAHRDDDPTGRFYHMHRYAEKALVEIGRALRQAEVGGD